MAPVDSDRNLLFGLLALQNGLIDQAQLVAAFQAWTLAKARPLAEHLVARGDLDADDRSAVEALVTRHLKKHGGSTERSLAAIQAGPSTRRSLQQVADPEIHASLAVLGPETDREGVLGRIAERTGALTCITLTSTEPGPEAPVVRDGEGVIDGLAGRYQVLGEIARGGMGAVLRGRDPDLGRDLALEVLLDKHRERPDLVDRFVEEAQICGQLQHPGVVPVYELGTMADHRPFFTMRLVKGQTLAALLAERSSPLAELPRFLGIFEAVCQTVAYAHARSVIHRDLKPSNVMVGAFGEVQVMDWGLAKVLPRDGQKEPASNKTMIATVRNTGDSDLSHAGSVVGTPAYMAPEQARGETESVDRRADVFALGSVLCEILTGAPAFSGGSAIEILHAADRGDTAAALARLVASAADAELLTLARDCLAPLAKDRPADAGVVTARITAYLAGVQERLRRAELARVEAVARAQEERKRRRLALALAATVVALMAVGGTGAAVYIQQSRDQATRLELALRDAHLLREQAQYPAEGDPAKWHSALAAVDRAADLLGPLSDSPSRREVLTLRQEVAAAAEAADRDSTLLHTLLEIRASSMSRDPFGRVSDASYAWAFRMAGLDIDELEPDAAAAQIRTRPAGVIPMLAAALDDWATQRRKARPKDIESSRRLIAVARAADPDETRDRLRAVCLQPEGKARREPLLALAKEADLRRWPVQTLTLMATSLLDADEPATAAELLERAQKLHPDDVWINHTLGSCLERVQPPRTVDAIRFYTAARALRPETAHDMAHALNRLARRPHGPTGVRDAERGRTPGRTDRSRDRYDRP
jgi:eukaryotic-like serine/threonine-protein kinase